LRGTWFLLALAVALPACGDSGQLAGDETFQLLPNEKIDAVGQKAALEYGRAIFVEHDCQKAASYDLFGSAPDMCAKYAQYDFQFSRKRLRNDCEQQTMDGEIVWTQCVNLRFVGTGGTADLTLWMSRTADGWRVNSDELVVRG
jgi:hypothetical protein